MKIIAHRGNDKIHKENSKEAILNSLNKNYVDGVEFDIRMTKDNNFILNHDPFYKEFFIRKTNSNILTKHKLPTLEDILNNIDSHKIIMIEVKEDTKNIKKVSKYLYKIISKYNLNIYLCSFNYNFIKYFKEKHQKIKCGLIVGTNINKKYIRNNLDFNSVSYKNKEKLPDKETFIWTVNTSKEIKNRKYNIITDNPEEMYKTIN